MGLEDVGQTLEQLWMSYNQIEKLDGLQPCVKLHTLFLSNNKIAKFRDAYTFASKDHIVATSSIQNEDGSWVEIMTGHFRRTQ